MKKKNKRIVIIVSIIILIIFTYVSYINIFPKKDLDRMKYISDFEDKSPKIINMIHEDGALKFDVENTKAMCVKSTKSIPSIYSICWKEVTNNTFSTSVYEFKMYYIWLLDLNNNISDPIIYDPNNNK